jgi:hypothetical protein
MSRLLLALTWLALAAASASADTIISIKPELSLNADGKAIVVNAAPYCPNAYVYVDTTTAAGKTMYAMGVAANLAEKTIHIQTGCTCNANCSGPVPVYRMCTALTGSQCQ